MMITRTTLAFTSAALLATSFTAAAAPEDSPFYTGVIQKIIDSKCIACHSPEKKKGKLELSTLETALKGGESGKPVITPGKSAESSLHSRLILPKDHDEHMPPQAKPQLSEPEIKIIQWWIDAGANKDLLIKDAQVAADLKPVVMDLAAKTVEKTKEAPKPVIAPKELDQATKDAIGKISTELGVTILQLAQSDTGLMFTAVNVADKFGDAEIAKFSPLAGAMVDLNLARTKITDAGLASLSQMKNLQRLRLENTAITDAGLDALKDLPKLEYLNLFNTQITDAGLAKLASLKGLKRLYAWQTKATKEAAQKLHEQNKELIINLGWDQEIGKPPVPPAPVPVAAATPPPATPANPEDPFFVAKIQPILAHTCNGCHGEKKQKGGFAAHTFDLLVKGGKEGGAGIVPGKSAESSIIKRIALPADDDEHMPPKDKPQPSEKEVKLLKWWIDQGADVQKKLKDVQIPADLN